MAEPNIPQQEAIALIQMEKVYQGEQAHDFPQPGVKLKMECESPDGSERFHLDVYRGTIDLRKVNHNFRARTSIPLLRLDVNTAPHRNPDGEKVGRTHLHIYREGYGDAWAYELSEVFPHNMPSLQLGDLTDLARTAKKFMTYCNITDQPTINPVLL